MPILLFHDQWYSEGILPKGWKRRNHFFMLRQQFPEIEKIWLLSVEAYVIWLEERLYSLQFNDAKERYALLIKKYPYIIQRGQLGYIASYLGITKETLSRIRG